jgi:hypothetical protein
MRFLFFLCIALTSVGSKAQLSVFQGNWNYFDTDSAYHELSISGNQLYQYNEGEEPTVSEVNIDEKTLAFSKKDKWVLYAKNNKYIDVTTNDGKMRIYKISRTLDTVKGYYDALNNPTPRKQKKVFSEEAEKRREALRRIHNTSLNTNTSR